MAQLMAVAAEAEVHKLQLNYTKPALKQLDWDSDRCEGSQEPDRLPSRRCTASPGTNVIRFPSVLLCLIGADSVFVSFLG